MLYYIQSLVFPTCIGCGSLFREEHLFCTPCFETKVENRIQLRKNINLDNHYYLMRWYPGQSDLISNYIYALKGIKAKAAWRFYANRIAKEFLNKYDLIVPIPSNKKLSQHSFYFAQCLADNLRLPCLKLLEKSPLVSTQKKLSKVNRLTIDIKKREQFTTVDISDQRILLVDDVLTTGSSFKAAKMALELAQTTEILTLFFRDLK